MVVLFDRFNLPEDIYEVIFATKQQIIVAKLLIDHIKENSRDSESAKGLIGDLDKIEKQREVLKLMAKFKNLTFQEMVDEGIIDTTLEQELF